MNEIKDNSSVTHSVFEVESRKVCVHTCIWVPTYTYVFFNTQAYTPTFPGNTCQYGPNEHVWNDWAVHTDVMGYNEGHEYNNEM